jgi:hypothetical protein
MSAYMPLLREMLSQYDYASGLSNGGTGEALDRELSRFNREHALAILAKYTDFTPDELALYKWRGAGRTRDLTGAHPAIAPTPPEPHAAMLRMALILGLVRHVEQCEREDIVGLVRRVEQCEREEQA